MIKINEKGSKAINTGENISDVLSTSIETGPKDELKAIDGYEAPSKDELEKLKGEDCGCDDSAESIAAQLGLSGGSGGGSGGSSGSSNNQDDTPGTNGLWTALLCGGSSRSGSGGSTPTKGQMMAVSLWMRLLGCEASDILKLVDTSGGEPKLDINTLKARLKTGIKGSYDNLSDEDKKSLLSSFKGDAEEENEAGGSESGESDGTSLNIDGVKKTFSAISLDDAKSFAELLKSANDDISVNVEDGDSKSHIQLAAFDKAVELNDPDSFGRIANSVERTPKTRRLFLGKTNKVAQSGNITMLNHLIDIVGVDMILSRYPRIIRDILRWYVLPTDKTKSMALVEFLATLNRLDGSWNSIYAYGGIQSDIEPYTWCGPDARNLLMSSPDHRTQVMIANDYRKADKYTLINKYHDYYAITA